MTTGKSKYQHPFEEFYENSGLMIMSDPAQHEFARAIQAPSDEVRAIFINADAGTGKTAVSLAGGVHGLQSERFDRIIYIRNSEPVEAIGFLPGDIQGKMGESLAVCEEAIDHIQPGLAKQLLERKSVIEGDSQLVLKPIAYLRGRDFIGNPLIIIDEAQNLTVHQLQTVLTRPHDTAKIIVIGSAKQVDPGNTERIGRDKLLAFEVFARHFKWNPSMATVSIELHKNYRGQFSQYADMIMDTVNWLKANSIYNSEGEEVYARVVSSNGFDVHSRRNVNSTSNQT